MIDAYMPFIDLWTIGSCQKGSQLLFSWRIDDRALIAVFMELCDKPEWNKIAKKSNATATGGGDMLQRLSLQ